MFCGKCGKEVKNSVAFCPFCGNKLPKEQEQPKYKEAVLENENREEVQEKKDKKSFMTKSVWKRIALAIGGVCVAVIVCAVFHHAAKTFEDKEVKTSTQVASTEDTNKQAKKVAEKQDHWNLFQSEDSAITLTAEEQEWTLLQLEKFAKGYDQAAWEENLLSFKVLGQATKEESMVSVDAICCTHPVGYTQFTTEIQYIKVIFSCEKEPEFADIEFKVCDSGDNPFTKAKASSACKPQRNMVSASKELSYYNAENVVDEQEDTAWIEGVKGYGKGEWISLSSTKQQKICGIAIQNGFIKSDRTLERNAQVKKVILTFSDGTKQTYELQKNKYGTCIQEWYSDCIIFDEPVDTSNVKLTIESVYQGKKFYEYWNYGSETKAQHSDKCTDTCISEIKVLTLPEENRYTEVTVEEKQEDQVQYDSWQKAYLDTIEQCEAVMERYNDNMKLYVDSFDVYHGTKEARYDEDGRLYLPQSGFVRDINGDSIPELFLVFSREVDYEGSAYKGNFAECLVHVFTYDSGAKTRLYCGSFATRFNEENEKESVFCKDERDGSLRTLQCLAGEDAEGKYFYYFWGLNHGKLVCKNVLVDYASIKSDVNAMTVRGYKKNGVSITKDAYDKECEIDAEYVKEIQVLDLAQLEENIQ